MTGKFKIENPDDVEVTLTVTMTLAQWKKLRDQLPTQWPSLRLGSMIGDVTRQAEMAFYPEHKTDGM